MKTQSKQLAQFETQADLSVPSFPLSLPFPTGYMEQVWCRGTNFRRDASGAILCTLHNAEGTINARISRPDVDIHLFHDWQLLHVDVVTTVSNGKLTAEVMKLRTTAAVMCSYLDLLPRSICALPGKLDELRHLVQFVQAPELRQVLENVFSDATIFLPFLTRFAGSERYTYPCGLLVRTVEAAKQAIGMGFQTQEEADMVLTAAFLYDLGRIRDGNLMSESLRKTIGFVPHPKSRRLIGFALGSAKCSLHVALEEIITTGFCNRYPSLHSDLKQKTVLARIDDALRG
ncbi:hypothetical protein D3878_14830 [Noviherbaspirillum sedimenti]|uniref:HD domain-containing protein n=2 Tax=Noviherbaspirillum sedimenti TaxID=2320865 RepID=A0A3A3G4C0_9BURK|nr:hypothetical protein D3878_14830 [Noviherbaspirillum sedimenti]